MEKEIELHDTSNYGYSIYNVNINERNLIAWTIRIEIC